MKLSSLTKAVTKTNELKKSTSVAQAFRVRTGLKAGEYLANY